MKAAGHFDGFAVAAHRAVVAGRVDAAALPRVADLLAADGAPAEIGYRITGRTDAAGRPTLEIVVAGTVPLTCQRCLQPFRWPFEQTTRVLLARDERELVRLDEGDHEHEVVLADAPLAALALVEDEVLLTLPFVPRCPEAGCAAAGAPREGDPAALKDKAEAAGRSPFGALAGLKAEPAKKAPR